MTDLGNASDGPRKCRTCNVLMRDLRLALHSPEPVWQAARSRMDEHVAEHLAFARARRRAFWRGFRDGLSLGPLWRWLKHCGRRAR